MQLAVTKAHFVSCGICQRSRSRPTHSAVARLNTHSNNTLSSQLQSNLYYKDAPDHGLRSGTLSATCVPPTKESLLLGPRVVHLSATEDSTLLRTVALQLQIPEAGTSTACCADLCADLCKHVMPVMTGMTTLLC